MRQLFRSGSWLLVFFMLLTSACVGQTTTDTKDEDKDRDRETFRPRDDSYYDKRNREDKDREDTLRKARIRYAQDDACSTDKDCEEICKDIYKRSKVRRDCLELPLSQVESLDQIYEAFERPRQDDLEEIDSEDFKTFVELDLKPLEILAGKLSSGETKRVIIWIVENGDIAEIFSSEDDEYKILEDMLTNIVSSGDNNLQTALSKNIQDGMSFMQLAVQDADNVMDWIHGMVEEKCNNDSDGEELCIFQKWYCETDLDDDDWADFVGYEDFESVMNDILQDYTTQSGDGTDDANKNPPNVGARASGGAAAWWEADTEAGEVESDEFDNMCKWKGRTGNDISPTNPNIVKK